MKVYLLRHGEVESGLEKRFIGQTDVPLSEMGVKQALWWRDALERVAFGSIYCSDLVRSLDTAKMLAEKQTSPVTVLPELREIALGEWDGLTVDEVKSAFPGEWEKRGQDISEYRPSGGENFSDLACRVLPTFEHIMDEIRKTTLIVGHAGMNRVILCEVLGIPLRHLFRLRQDYGALNIIERSLGYRQVCLMNLRPQSP
jgi:alpha-ribazole phosphatase